MEKINIAKLLRDCPKGMELDCTMFVHPVTLDEVINDDTEAYPISVVTHTGNLMTLTKYGTYCFDEKDAKCVIFPKGKTTWEGFNPPCKFKDGDIVFYDNTVAIFKEWDDETLFRTHVTTYLHYDSFIDVKVPLFGKSVRKEIRYANEKETEKLFKAIKSSGYRWNAETKVLEKLVEPQFKVGDNIRIKGKSVIHEVTSLQGDHYKLDNKNISLLFKNQDQWELVPNKFDVSTLKPFNKVLVRCSILEKWRIQFFEKYDKTYPYPFICLGCINYKQCIPYECNEHLLDTANDCQEFYKNWE